MVCGSCHSLEIPPKKNTHTNYEKIEHQKFPKQLTFPEQEKKLTNTILKLVKTKQNRNYEKFIVKHISNLQSKKKIIIIISKL